MITYNGIELDYQSDTLNSLVIKGGLTKIENLTDRTGTSSTQFTLPRTANNELAFGNITTEGANLTTSGVAYITLDGNIFSKGVLYVMGYDNNNFKCLFMGSDNDLIGTLKKLPLRSVFNELKQITYTDASVKTALESVVAEILGQNISYHFGHPQENVLQGAGEFKFENIAPYFSLRHLVYKMFSDQNIDLVSNFLDSDYGQSLDWSNFDGTHLSSNTFQNGSNSLSASTPIDIDLGTGLANNNSISVGTYSDYTLDNDCSTLSIKGLLNYTSSVEIESVQVYVIIFRPPTAPAIFPSALYSTLGVYNDGGLLFEGDNYFDITINRAFLAGDYILIQRQTLLKDGYSFPISGGSVLVDNMIIAHDGIQVGDALNWANYASKETQFDFLKKFLVQFNCVLDIDGDQAYIELQDAGVEPIGTSPASLPSIASSQFDLTPLVEENTTTEVEYLKGDLVYLSQTIASNNYVDEQEIFKYQKIGSYLFVLNTFSNNRIEVYEGGFNTLFDYIDFSIVDFGLSGLSYSTTWESYVSSRFGYFNEVYNETYGTMSFINSNLSTTNVDALINWSRPVWFSRTWKALFKNTLEQKKNNKIIEVIFRDELGTIVSNRKEYIYKDQVYKIVEWSYDIIKKLVKAKLIMK
jgi:hypothetical protein